MSSSYDKAFLIDRSALLAGVTSLVREGRLVGRIVVHGALVRKLWNDVSRGLVTSEIALEELGFLKDVTERFLMPFEVVWDGDGRDLNDVLRRYSMKHGTTLVTADPLQAKAAAVLGVDCVLISPKQAEIPFENLFDSNTMSLHIKEGTTIKAKRGSPGNWQFLEVTKNPVTAGEIKRMLSEVVLAVGLTRSSFVEIERKGSTVIQLGNYRIVVTRPPLSDGWEMTVTRPVTKKSLEDYGLDERLVTRFKEKAEGILVAGAPGMGKTTFAQALAEYYMKMEKVVKTVESPRDMDLPSEITQYSKNYAEVGELHDILLLSRPDYTVYDEMRNDEDFKLFIDLRLAGIGMIGVVHATTPIDAIHRFLSRNDLGTVPNIVDTVVFIEKGQVAKVFSLNMVVKIPTGLREADLARPVVEVRDFLTDSVEYEMYVFGEQTMIVRVKDVQRGQEHDKVGRIISKYVPRAVIKFEGGEYVISLPRSETSRYNKVASRLRKLEKKLGVRIRVQVAENGSSEEV
ncbi:ATPase [Sulfodiicoccus acidiphilus]|uniref:ATPase n=1 Tax=Sulfodiicoccus acidiphilus TaxID=1670455 RepID=A0A348B752_9CREN|nr:ATPase, T2SS/T4P/T4SS family [Sulfodiicoccus acidiphilus]BBD74004.1 ATPase [Sulfodiicoccus acidiphilus]GGT87227.1 ATPase [Sulfodiicoccus acidiphilus]